MFSYRNIRFQAIPSRLPVELDPTPTSPDTFDTSRWVQAAGFLFSKHLFLPITYSARSCFRPLIFHPSFKKILLGFQFYPTIGFLYRSVLLIATFWENRILCHETTNIGLSRCRLAQSCLYTFLSDSLPSAFCVSSGFIATSQSLQTFSPLGNNFCFSTVVLLRRQSKDPVPLSWWSKTSHHNQRKTILPLPPPNPPGCTSIALNTASVNTVPGLDE